MKCLLPLFFFGDIKSTFIIAFSSGWPFRLSYGGRVAKHRIEVKKAVFCESTSQVQIVFLYVWGLCAFYVGPKLPKCVFG